MKEYTYEDCLALADAIDHAGDRNWERGKCFAEGFVHGLEEGLRAALHYIGTKKFGKPDRKTAKRIESIQEYAQLRRLTLRVLDVENWKELLHD